MINTFDNYWKRIELSEKDVTAYIKEKNVLNNLKNAWKEYYKHEDEIIDGDFVYIHYTKDHELKEKHICVGNQCEKELQELLKGKKINDFIQFDGCEGRIISVKRAKEFDVENGDYSLLNIPQVKNKEDYYQYYINLNKESYQRQVQQRIYTKIENQLFEIALKDIEVIFPMDEKEFCAKVQKNQKQLILIQLNHDEQVYEKAMEQTYHKGSIELNEKEMQVTMGRQYRLSYIAEKILKEDVLKPNIEEYENYVSNLASIANMELEKFKQIIDYDEYSRMYFIQMLQDKILEKINSLIKHKIL